VGKFLGLKCDSFSSPNLVNNKEAPPKSTVLEKVYFAKGSQAENFFLAIFISHLLYALKKFF